MFDTVNKSGKASSMQPEDWPELMRNFKDYGFEPLILITTQMVLPIYDVEGEKQ